jgi:hypothetical protein
MGDIRIIVRAIPPGQYTEQRRPPDQQKNYNAADNVHLNPQQMDGNLWFKTKKLI